MPEVSDISQVAQAVPDEPVNKPTNRKSYQFLVYLVIFLFGTVFGFFLNDRIIKSNVTEERNIQEKSSMITGASSAPQTGVDESKLALISHLPNFDSLTVRDLPNMIDTRGVYEYNGRYIVASVDRLVEYDSKSEMIVRTNNPTVLPCIFSTAIIGDNLYVTCNKVVLDVNGNTTGKSTLVRLNLTSGSITNRYFETDAKPRINFWVTSLGTDLWGSSWDGVFKMDTTTQKVVEYSSQSIGYPNCRPGRIYIKNNAVRVQITNGSDCPGGVAEYDTNTNTWKQLPDSNEAVQAVNEVPKVEGKTLPLYVAVSPRIDDLYYLFANDAVYTVSRMGFPIKFKKLNSTIDSVAEPVVYISPDKQYSLIIGLVDGMGGNTLAQTLPIYLITMQTGAVYNLTSSYTQDLGPTNTIIQTSSQGFTFTTQPHGVLIIGKNNKNLFATVDFPSHSLIFPVSNP